MFLFTQTIFGKQNYVVDPILYLVDFVVILSLPKAKNKLEFERFCISSAAEMPNVVCWMQLIYYGLLHAFIGGRYASQSTLKDVYASQKLSSWLYVENVLVILKQLIHIKVKVGEPTEAVSLLTQY